MSRGALMAALALPAMAAADPVDGVWTTEPRDSGAYLAIRIGPCDAAPETRCGTIVGALAGAPEAYVGDPILRGMRAAGPGRWEDGEIIRPGSGTVYDSTLEVRGDRLIVQGCAVAGLFCGESVWDRAD